MAHKAAVGGLVDGLRIFLIRMIVEKVLLELRVILQSGDARMDESQHKQQRENGAETDMTHGKPFSEKAGSRFQPNGLRRDRAEAPLHSSGCGHGRWGPASGARRLQRKPQRRTLSTDFAIRKLLQLYEMRKIGYSVSTSRCIQRVSSGERAKQTRAETTA